MYANKKTPKFLINYGKKLASQIFSSKNGNESIMVTSHFFTFFGKRRAATFPKWTFINVQNGKPNARLKFAFF